MDCPDTSEVLKTSFNKVFATKVDIFEKCAARRAPFERVTLEEISSTAEKLQAYRLLNILDTTISEVADALV